MSKMGRHMLEKQTEKENYIMQRTEVLCPNCMKKKVIQETSSTAYCDECGQQYNKQQDSNTLRFI